MQRLRELGWIEGRTVAIEYRWAEGRSERLRRDRGRVRPAQGRCHCHAWDRSRPGGKAGDIGHPDRLRRWRGTRSAAASSRALRGRAATSPACRSSRPILPASGSNFCARLSPGLRRLAIMVNVGNPAAVLEMGEVQAAARTLGLEVATSKSGERRISRPLSRRSRAVRTHFMSCADPLV